MQVFKEKRLVEEKRWVLVAMLVPAADFCRAEAGGVKAAKSRPGFRPFHLSSLIGQVESIGS